MAPKEMYPSPVPKYPTYRDDAFKSPTLWLKGKEVDDGAEKLWRVHDDLYDFSSWIHNHPGGSDWLILTKGTDITEAFESHHIRTTASYLLKHFYVRPATTPRNSPYSFHEDGFYKTIKKRVREQLKTIHTKSIVTRSDRIADLLFSTTVVLAVLAACHSSYLLASLSGFVMALTVITAHNYVHQKDNFRMHYFDLSLMSSRDWRISHVLSHHLYPNSILDLELSLFEPLFQFLPDPSKTSWARYGPMLYAPVVYSLMYMTQFYGRIQLFFKGYMKSLTKEDFFPFLLPATMIIISSCGLFHGLVMWLYILAVSGFWFGAISLNGAHHHPEIFHDGDAPRADRDWGIAQLDTNRDRPAVCTNLFLILTNFGHHGLHHLFPTMDHSILPMLEPVFRKTLDEFKVSYPGRSVLDLYSGQFRQIARNEPNPVPPGAN